MPRLFILVALLAGAAASAPAPGLPAGGRFVRAPEAVLDPRFAVPLAFHGRAATLEGPVEVDVDFAALLARLGEPGPFEPHSLRASAGGRPVPFQFDEEAPGRGSLIVLVPRGRRVIDVAFDSQSATPVPAADTAAGLPADRRVRVEDVADWAGQAAWRIETPAATYVLHREGAGLASLIDADGRDWLSYRPGGGAAGEYRGLPNLGPFAHPGYAAKDGEARGSRSRLVSRGPLRASVLAERHGGGYALRYDFFPGSARVTVLEADGPYWFLYEGTPGGRLDLERGFSVVSPGTRRSLAEEWHGDLPDPEWAYFGNRGDRRVLFLAAHDADAASDQYWPMEGRMTVFGFGREFRCCGRFLTGPRRFTFGLVESQSQDAVVAAIRRTLATPRVEVGAPSRTRGKENPR